MSENLNHVLVFMLHFTRVFRSVTVTVRDVNPSVVDFTEYANEAAVLKCGCVALGLFTAAGDNLLAVFMWAKLLRLQRSHLRSNLTV